MEKVNSGAFVICYMLFRASGDDSSGAFSFGSGRGGAGMKSKGAALLPS